MKTIAICSGIIFIGILSACDNQLTKSKATIDSLVAKIPTDLVTIPKDHLFSEHLKAMEKAKDVERLLEESMKKRMSILDGITQ